MTLSSVEWSFLSGRAHELRRNGASVQHIANQLKVSWSTGKNLLVGKRKERGKKRKLARTQARRKQVKQIARLKRRRADGKQQPQFCSAASVATELKKRGVIVSKRTVVRDLHAVGGSCRVRPTVPSIDDTVFAKRLTLAKEWRNKPEDEINSLVFADESKVSLNDHGQRSMWVFPGDTVVPRERKRRDENVNSFQIFACIGHNFRFITSLRPAAPRQVYPRGRPKKGEVRPPKEKRVVRLNGEGYLNRCVMPMRRAMRGRILFHDGARPHIAGVVKNWCTANRLKVVQNAPYTPQMNPVENIFPLLHREITKRDPTTLDELESAVYEGFASIPTNTINKIAASFKNRCAQAIKTKGKFF